MKAPQLIATKKMKSLLSAHSQPLTPALIAALPLRICLNSRREFRSTSIGRNNKKILWDGLLQNRFFRVVLPKFLWLGGSRKENRFVK